MTSMRTVALIGVAVLVAGLGWTVGTVAGPLLDGRSSDGAVVDVPLPGDVAPIGEPASDDGVGPTPADRLPLEARLDFWTARVADRPEDFLSLTQLAMTEVEGARLGADLAAYERAAGLVDRALAVLPAYPPTIRARGQIRFALHDFRGALTDAEQVLAAAPGDAAALALAGDAALELGDLTTASARYDQLRSIAPGPWLDVRRARLASAGGDHAGALRLARAAAASATTLDPADEGVYALAVGEYARLAGDATTARAAYTDALRLRPDDLGAIIGLARIDAAEGRSDAAVDGLRRAAAIAPQPETLGLLGDVLLGSGDERGAAEAFETVRLIGQLGDVQGTVDDRVILRFELDHGGDASRVLAAARAGLTDRPDAGGHDLVAWALHRLGRDEEALASIAAARASGNDDARLTFHEGAIRLALGDPTGPDLLARALAMGAALDPVERAEAERLLGQ